MEASNPSSDKQLERTIKGTSPNLVKIFWEHHACLFCHSSTVKKTTVATLAERSLPLNSERVLAFVEKLVFIAALFFLGHPQFSGVRDANDFSLELRKKSIDILNYKVERTAGLPF